jgi:hypothetical protein
MKVYNVMSMSQYDYDFNVNLHQNGCYSNKQDAIKQKEKEVAFYKNIFSEEIEKYGDKELYPEGDVAALYIEDDEIYFEMSYGSDEYHTIHQVWIDELEVK